MVRPERRELLAGASPVRVSARAPGSRPQPKGEIQPARAGRRKPVKEQGAKKRAAISCERRDGERDAGKHLPAPVGPALGEEVWVAWSTDPICRRFRGDVANGIEGEGGT